MPTKRANGVNFNPCFQTCKVINMLLVALQLYHFSIFFKILYTNSASMCFLVVNIVFTILRFLWGYLCVRLFHWFQLFHQCFFVYLFLSRIELRRLNVHIDVSHWFTCIWSDHTGYFQQFNYRACYYERTVHCKRVHCEYELASDH